MLRRVGHEPDEPSRLQRMGHPVVDTTAVLVANALSSECTLNEPDFTTGIHSKDGHATGGKPKRLGRGRTRTSRVTQARTLGLPGRVPCPATKRSIS